MAPQSILSIYDGYFSRKDCINLFIKSVPDFHGKSKIRILDFGGGEGHLLLEVRNHYKNKGKEIEGWILDKNREDLSNSPTGFNKINQSAVSFVKEGYFDLIIMRSVMQFFLSSKDKVKVLNNIFKSLSKRGVFVNQAFFMESPDNRFLEKAFGYFGRKLKVETLEGLSKLYGKSKFQHFKRVLFFPKMIMTDQTIKERFGLSDPLISRILRLFEMNKSDLKSISLNEGHFSIEGSYVLMEALR